MATLLKPVSRTRRLNIAPTPREVFTARELGQLVGVSPQTIRRAIEAGELKAAQSGQHGHFRISRAEAQAWWTQRGGGTLLVYITPKPARAPRSSRENATADTPEARAKAILEGLHSDDAATRNATIIALSQADDETSRIVEEAAARAVEAWQGEEDDLSNWRALDTEPFHFPEEAPDYLTGLYRSDAKTEEAAA